MTSSSRVQLGFVRESTPGTTPNTPRMRLARYTQETLSFAPEYLDSDEIRSDRMLGDPMRVMQASQGGINGELSYPVNDTFLSDVIRSAMFSTWLNTPERDNDGTADSVITGVASSGSVITVTTGDAFVAGQIVRATGFTNSGNNGLHVCTTGSATVPAFSGSTLTDEAAPPGTARLKVVGFQGASGDITALADGIGSTALNFTTLGLRKGQWVKIGGTADATTFAFLVTAGATARGAAFARVTAIAADKLTLDNLPSGWTTDSGTGKTIQVWFGDQIKNGVTHTSLTFERGFLGQNTPSYIVNTGMRCGQFEIAAQSRQKVTFTSQWTGMGGGVSTTALDASPDAQTTGQVMAANANVGRLSEGGSRLTSPNWAMEFRVSINNNLRTLESIDETSPVAVAEGECTVSGTINTYFGSKDVLEKFYNGTVTSLNSRIAKNNQAIIVQIPRATLRGGGTPQVTGKNTDTMASFEFSGSYDSETGASIVMDRMEYFAS